MFDEDISQSWVVEDRFLLLVRQRETKGDGSCDLAFHKSDGLTMTPRGQYLNDLKPFCKIFGYSKGFQIIVFQPSIKPFDLPLKTQRGVNPDPLPLFIPPQGRKPFRI